MTSASIPTENNCCRAAKRAPTQNHNPPQLRPLSPEVIAAIEKALKQ
jgi:hypothetical protein